MNAAAQRLPLRVIKLGGSLLRLPDLAVRFYGWRVAQQTAIDIVIVGGGSFVDSLRATQLERGLADMTCHWLAVQAMSKNAAAVAKMFPDSKLSDNMDSVRRDTSSPKLVVFDSAEFLHCDRGAGSLPTNWDTTSDSIAARVATCCGADELVLLKSALPEQDWTLADMSKVGFVDRHFAVATADLPLVRIVNLRDASFSSVVFETTPACLAQ
jgi:aspartokinase-like uncharacterized kinase